MIRIEKFRANDCGPRILKAANHFFEPMWFNNFDIIVKQENVFTSRSRNSSIGRARKVKRLNIDDREKRNLSLLISLVQGKHTLIGRTVVHNDDFEQWI